jgi:hypothetical protein
MRLSDLLQSPVLDEDGNMIGKVEDVRAVQDGPIVGGFGASLRIDGLVVGRRTDAVRLGFHRAQVRGPWLLKAVLERRESRARFAEWSRVQSWEDGIIRITGRASDLGPPPVLEL